MSIYTGIHHVTKIELGDINEIVRNDGKVIYTRKISIQCAPDQRIQLDLFSEDEASWLKVVPS